MRFRSDSPFLHRPFPWPGFGLALLDVWSIFTAFPFFRFLHGGLGAPAPLCHALRTGLRSNIEPLSEEKWDIYLGKMSLSVSPTSSASFLLFIVQWTNRGVRLQAKLTRSLRKLRSSLPVASTIGKPYS